MSSPKETIEEWHYLVDWSEGQQNSCDPYCNTEEQREGRKKEYEKKEQKLLLEYEKKEQKIYRWKEKMWLDTGE